MYSAIQQKYMRKRFRSGGDTTLLSFLVPQPLLPSKHFELVWQSRICFFSMCRHIQQFSKNIHNMGHMRHPSSLKIFSWALQLISECSLASGLETADVNKLFSKPLISLLCRAGAHSSLSSTSIVLCHQWATGSQQE